jgi:surface protein
MFSDCKSLFFLPNISKWNIDSVVNMDYMFYNCESLSYLPDLKKWNINKEADINSMFKNCYSLLTVIKINPKINSDIKYKEKESKNFYEIEDIIKENLKEFNNNFKKQKNKNSISGYLYIKLKEIEGNILLFNYEINKEIDVYLNHQKINMIKENNTWMLDYDFKKNGKYAFEIIFNDDDATDLTKFFEDCIHIISLDFSNFDTSNAINMEAMFVGCNKLKKIKGLDNFITNEVTSMKEMFEECYELEYLDLSNFNTSNVRDFSWMFNQCNKLKYLNLLNFTLNNCKTKNMFVFNQKKDCMLITSNKQILDLYNSS